MKRLSVVFVTLAVLAMALAGCSNPVNAPNSPTSTGDFSVFIDMDQAKGLYDYQVMGVFVKGFEIDDNGAPVALQNTSLVAKLVPTSHKYVTALTPVYDERKGKHVEFTRKQLGWTASFRFDTILEPNRALKFVAWGVGYDGVEQQFDASVANDAWRRHYMLSADYENDAWDAVSGLEVLDDWINTKIADAITIYNDSGVPFQYPPIKWLPVKVAIDNLDAKYHLYIEKLDELPVDEDPANVNDILQYQEWLELGPLSPVESNSASPAWAQKLAYEAAYAAYQAAHTFYQTNPDPAPAIEPKIPTVFTDAVRAAIEARHAALQTGSDLFNAYDGSAGEWRIMRDNTGLGSARYLYDMIALGEATGHRVIYHTEADRYFRLPMTAINLVWTENNFMVGNVGPGGGMVVYASDSTYPPLNQGDVSKALNPFNYASSVAPKLQPVAPMIVEVSYKDASSDTSWYWNGNAWLTQNVPIAGLGWLDETKRDKFINEVIAAENSVIGGLYSSNTKNGYNGVTDWTLPNQDQIRAYAYYLDEEGYSNGNLTGGKKYYTYDPLGTETRYGYITPDYDENTVLETPIPYDRIVKFGFWNNIPAIVGNVRLAKAWYKTNAWVSNNLVLPPAPPVD